MPPPNDTAIHNDSLVYDARGKITYTIGLGEEDFEGYSALGTLWRSIRSNADTGKFNNDERFVADAMGNAVQHISKRKDITAQSYDSVVTTYERGTGRLTATHEQNTQDTTLYTDAGARAFVGVGSGDGMGNFAAERTHYYYRPDGLLVGVDHRTCQYGAPATDCIPTQFTESIIKLKGAFEDYRYDALGRRVVVRTRADTVCEGPIGQCVGSLMWVAWDGNQIAEEMRGAGGGTVSADSLEQGLPPGDPALAPFYGTVSYLNGPTMDEPLEIQGIQPYRTWRGLIDNGDCLTGSCGTGPIDWPGLTYEAYLSVIPSRQTVPRSWHGSLFGEGQDDGGLMYRRNRYYDPATGQFTQEDPLGLAGGMNAYGFANGDPVNYTDPFGLCGHKDEQPCQSSAAVAAVGASAAVPEASAISFGGGGEAISVLSPPTIAVGGFLAFWAALPVRPTVDPPVTGFAAADATAVRLPQVVPSLGNRIRSLITGLLIGKGGGMSDEQKRIWKGGEKPANEQTQPERPKKKDEPKEPDHE